MLDVKHFQTEDQAKIMILLTMHVVNRESLNVGYWSWKNTLIIKTNYLDISKVNSSSWQSCNGCMSQLSEKFWDFYWCILHAYHEKSIYHVSPCEYFNKYFQAV